MFSAGMFRDISWIYELAPIVAHRKSVDLKSEFHQGVDLASDEAVGRLWIGVHDVRDLQLPSPVAPMIDFVPPGRSLLIELNDCWVTGNLSMRRTMKTVWRP